MFIRSRVNFRSALVLLSSEKHWETLPRSAFRLAVSAAEPATICDVRAMIDVSYILKYLPLVYAGANCPG